MKHLSVIFLTTVGLLLCLSVGSDGLGISNPFSFIGCLRRKLGVGAIFNSNTRCTGWSIYNTFKVMDAKTKKCKNCHQYFYCFANYKGIAKCKKTKDNIRAAEAVTVCRKFAEGGMTSKGDKADMAAARLGREGGDCAAKYLCNVECGYNPKTKTCSISKCKKTKTSEPSEPSEPSKKSKPSKPNIKLVKIKKP